MIYDSFSMLNGVPQILLIFDNLTSLNLAKQSKNILIIVIVELTYTSRFAFLIY